jgi:branched-chain amino acid transport system permease protein
MGLQEVLAAGLALGAILATLAIAYAITFGVLGVINFALGEAFMAGAFLFLGARILLGASVLAAIESAFLAVAGVACLGCCEYLVAFHPLLRRPGTPPLLLLISSLGMSLILQNAVLVWVASGNVPFPSPIAWRVPRIGAFSPSEAVALVVAGIGSAFGLWLIAATPVGRAMRCVRDDRELAEIVGISPLRTGLTAFALSHGIAALAGIAMGWYTGTTRFDSGFLPGIKAFSGALLGGIGDPFGALAGGLALGLSESFAARYVSSQYKDFLAFMVLVLVLLWRPRGILGKGRR